MNDILQKFCMIRTGRNVSKVYLHKMTDTLQIILNIITTI